MLSRPSPWIEAAVLAALLVALALAFLGSMALAFADNEPDRFRFPVLFLTSILARPAGGMGYVALCWRRSLRRAAALVGAVPTAAYLLALAMVAR